MGIFVYLRASRLPFLTGSLLPVAAATALAYVTDHTWNFLFFGLTALGVAALHLGANLINDYYDSFGSDPLNRNFISDGLCALATASSAEMNPCENRS